MGKNWITLALHEKQFAEIFCKLGTHPLLIADEIQRLRLIAALERELEEEGLSLSDQDLRDARDEVTSGQKIAAVVAKHKAKAKPKPVAASAPTAKNPTDPGLP